MAAELKEILSLATQIGLPGVVLLGLLFGGWKAARWTGTNCLLPITTRAIRFFDQVDTRLDSLSASIKAAACRYLPCDDADCKVHPKPLESRKQI